MSSHVIYEKYQHTNVFGLDRVFVSLHPTKNAALKELERIAFMRTRRDGSRYEMVDEAVDFGRFSLAIMPLREYVIGCDTTRENIRIQAHMLAADALGSVIDEEQE